jgi:pimeloyl-ACP methyl ester carboxylesterase
VTQFVSTAEGVRTACEITGQGAPLLLMHGAEASLRMFDALVPLLAPHFTVIAYDQRDCGSTESPPQPATLAELAHDALALLQGLGFARAHVFGSSFGGRVAQTLAGLHPQAVDRLALGSTWPLPHALAALNPDGVRRVAELRQQLPESAPQLAQWFFPEALMQAQPHLRTFFARVQATSDRSLRRAQAVDSTLALDWGAINMPALLLAGELDRLVPCDVTLGMQAQLPQARQVLLADVGHATALQAPEALAEHLIRFFTADHNAIAASVATRNPFPTAPHPEEVLP